MSDVSALAITLARIATHPMWMNYQEYPGDREAIAEAAKILRNLTTEWGLRDPEGFVVKMRPEPDWEASAEEVARKRAQDAPEYWTAVQRQVTITEWEALP